MAGKRPGDAAAGRILCHFSGSKERRSTISYLDDLKTESSRTRTLNGAQAYGATGDACLDFFAVAGGMRYRSESAQTLLFDRAYIENPDLAMKLLFHLRDIRGGMGERKLFRTLLRHVAFDWTESAERNVEWVAEFGRWDDLLCLLETPAQDAAVRVIRAQLDADLAALKRREAGEQDAHISLLAKWLPSDNTSSRETRRLAGVLYRALGMERLAYRRALTALRARIGLTERSLTAKQHGKIRYEAVPAQAMLKYRSAFRRADGARYKTYLDDVRSGDSLIHADTLFPYEVARPFFRGAWHVVSANGADALEQLWRRLPGAVGSVNAISVVDTSGSMFCGAGPVIPALISMAMGLYCAERCEGAFQNCIITFEDEPHLVKVRGRTLFEKLRYLETLPWGFSTNLEAVFDLLLRTAVNRGAKQEELPQVIYIFSDMEFNAAVRDADKTVYENAREAFEEAGYRMPAVVFHNVNSWQMQAPVTAHTRGAALTSGSSAHSVSHRFDGNVTPMEHMLRVLCGPRYAMIRA